MKIIHRLYFSFFYRLSRKIERNPLLFRFYKFLCFTILKPRDIKKIPLIINNHNHYSYLKDLIDWLEANGLHNYFVIDNDSTYPPLLAYYQTKLAGRVIYLKKNAGHLALWHHGVMVRFPNTFYVYTDPDILPVLKHNPDFLEQLYRCLKKYDFALKAGCALRIDDLPDCFALKNEVVKHESKFWQKALSADVYHADVDTTFSLYLPNFYEVGKWGTHIRVAGNCLVRHQPWYQDSADLTAEQQYYRDSATSYTHWTNFNNNPAQA